MRAKALITDHVRYKKAIVYTSGEADTYLFVFDSPEDVDCLGDEWYPSADDAFDAAEHQYGVARNAWALLPDPSPGMRHDREAMVPVRPQPPLVTVQAADVAPALRAAVQELLGKGRTFDAIRLVQHELRLGLYSARKLVDALRVAGDEQEQT